MAKWYGAIGYAVNVEANPETSPGVWTEQITERMYFGEVIRNNRRLQSSAQLNDDINISNEISILSDPFATENFHSIRYVEYMGTKWKVPNADASQYPRITLTLGGVYNGD